MSFFLKLLILLFLFIGGGCANTLRAPQTLRAERGLDFARSVSSNQPFDFKILQEFNDGQTLFVVAEVKSKTEWPLDEVALRLATYKDGEVLREARQALTQVLKVNEPQFSAEALRLGESAKFSMSIPSEGMSTYQLELLWGDEALPYLDLAPETKGLELKQVMFERVACLNPPCSLEYSVSGQLYNSGKQTVNTVRLATAWSLDGQASQGLQDVVTLKQLGIAPGSGRELRIKLSTPLPPDLAPELAERYKPEIRVISYEG